jgi:predicted acetyltransferase
VPDMSPHIRTVREADVADFAGWIRAVKVGFLVSAPVTDEEVRVRRPWMDLSRTQGAYDQGRCVATFASMRRELTVPGGAVVDADAITGVTVTATHRRRGLLTRMMASDLAAATERGEPVAVLIAAEYPIYGRFGFGPATWVTDWEIDVSRAQLGRFQPPAHGSIELVEPAEAARLGPELHDRFRRLTPGAINRPDPWWQLNTGQTVYASDPYTPKFFAVYRDSATGRVDGMAAYQTDETWHSKRPAVNLTVRGLITATGRRARPVALSAVRRLGRRGQDRPAPTGRRRAVAPR